MPLGDPEQVRKDPRDHRRPGRRKTAETTARFAALLPAVVLLGLGVGGTPATAQVGADLYGWIRDASTGAPIPQAEVRLISSGQTTLTSEQGLFTFEGLGAGVDSVAVTVIGYRTRRAEVLLIPGQSARLHVELAQEAIELDPIDVSVRPSLRARRIQEFARRSELYAGFFLHENELTRKATAPLGNLLGNLPGVTIEEGSVRDQVRGGTPFKVFFRGGQCTPTVWVNGQRAWAPQDALASIRANQIEALELYRAGEAPAEFSATGRCVTVVVWTR